MRPWGRAALALMLCAALLLSVPAGAAADTGTRAFYTQLGSAGQSVYDAFCLPENLDCFRRGESFTLRFPGPFDDADEAAGELLAAQTAALGAFLLDHPELFWLEDAPAQIEKADGALVMTVTPRFREEWSVGGRSASGDAERVAAAVKALAEEARARGSVYDRLLYVHDWLTAHNEYNNACSASDGLPRTPLSALTDAGQPVSQGYAAAFKLVCDELGIPCLLAAGLGGVGCIQERHVWDQVLLDGRWYAVDAAYDDPTVYGAGGSASGYEHHANFLAGADTYTDACFTFSELHEATGELLEGVFFSYPPLSAEAWSGGGGAVGRMDIPLAGTAAESTQTVTVDGRRVTLHAYALPDGNGRPVNFVRLRDLAALLDGTEAEFDVLWSRETGVSILSGRPYSHPNGSEGDLPFSGDQPYAAWLEDTCVDGTALPLTAFRITWEGRSHTFYPLRDLGRVLGFNVGWTRERGLFIETDRPYSDED